MLVIKNNVICLYELNIESPRSISTYVIWKKNQWHRSNLAHDVDTTVKV